MEQITLRPHHIGILARDYLIDSLSDWRYGLEHIARIKSISVDLHLETRVNLVLGPDIICDGCVYYVPCISGDMNAVVELMSARAPANTFVPVAQTLATSPSDEDLVAMAILNLNRSRTYTWAELRQKYDNS